MPDIGFDAISAAVVFMTAYAYAIAMLGRRSQPPSHGAPELAFIVLVPCLNEGTVIARTVRGLLALRGAVDVIVIDDDSDDESISALAEFEKHPRFHLLRRRRPNARLGKGEALNAGLHPVRELVRSRALRTDTVVVSVFDSDGRVDADYLERITPYFADAAVDAVQSAVRMYNSSSNLLTRWQDMEFVIWGELFSRGKDFLGSATLGGNGQFVRLSALDRIGERPWRPSLTEDLDLSLRLLIAGGRIRFCPSTSVAQQAIPRMRPLLRQRARWMQGHLVAWQYLGDILGSRLPLRARFDLLIFLLLPALFVPIGVTAVFSWISFASTFGAWTVADVLASYVLGFPLAPLVALAIRRRYAGSWATVARDAHAYFAYSAVWFVAGWLALVHVIRGRHGWVKTARVAETETLGNGDLHVAHAASAVAFVFGTPADVLRLGPVADAVQRLHGVNVVLIGANDPAVQMLLREMRLRCDSLLPVSTSSAEGSAGLAPVAGALESAFREQAPSGCVVSGAGPWAASGLVAASLLDIPCAHLAAVAGNPGDVLRQVRLRRALLSIPVVHVVEGKEAARALYEGGVPHASVAVTGDTMGASLRWLGPSTERPSRGPEAAHLLVSLGVAAADGIERVGRWMAALHAIRPRLSTTIDGAGTRLPASVLSMARMHPGIRVAELSPAGWFAELLMSDIVISDSNEVLRRAAELERGVVMLPSSDRSSAREAFNAWVRQVDVQLRKTRVAVEEGEGQVAARQAAHQIVRAFGLGLDGDIGRWGAAGVPAVARP